MSSENSCIVASSLFWMDNLRNNWHTFVDFTVWSIYDELNRNNMSIPKHYHIVVHLNLSQILTNTRIWFCHTCLLKTNMRRYETWWKVFSFKCYYGKIWITYWLETMHVGKRIADMKTALRKSHAREWGMFFHLLTKDSMKRMKKCKMQNEIFPRDRICATLCVYPARWACPNKMK